MKILVAYFSRTGNTRKIAEILAEKLSADLDEITEVKKRGFLGVTLKGTRDAMKGNPSEVTFSKNPIDYDLVILGGPVWAWNLIPPLRGYLNKNKDAIKKFAFFLTFGGNFGKNFEEVEKIKKPISTMAILDKDMKKGNTEKYGKQIEEFIGKLELD